MLSEEGFYWFISTAQYLISTKQLLKNESMDVDKHAQVVKGLQTTARKEQKCSEWSCKVTGGWLGCWTKNGACCAGLTNTPSTWNCQKAHWHSLSELTLTNCACSEEQLLMAREDSGPSHLSILCTCHLSFPPVIKANPPRRDHPTCLLNTTTQNPLQHRSEDRLAPAYHCYNEHRGQKTTSPLSLFTWLE